MKFAVVLSVVACADATTQADLKRAKSKVPSEEYKGDDQSSMSKVLNGHLRKGNPNVKECDQWTTQGLQEFMGHIAPHRSEELMSIYEESNDKRSPQLKTFADHMDHWTHVNRLAKGNNDFEVVAREAHCREAVMWWVHHLPAEKRTKLTSQQVTVPLLPEGEKKQCTGHKVCDTIIGTSTCDWCHSKEADRGTGPGTKAPLVVDVPDGPDDGNPKGWDRIRRCDQNYPMNKGKRGCQPCEGIGGHAYSDNNTDIDIPDCKVLAHAKSEKYLIPSVKKPIYPKKFTVKTDTSGGFGELDTLIGWQLPTDVACLSFFPQNDSSSYPLCYRDQSANLKIYDIENERGYFEYQIGPNKVLNLTNTTTHIMHNKWQMWVMNWIPFKANPEPTPQCVCTNPSGQHCTDPPCYSYVFNYDTFEDAEYLGREEIGVEWIEDSGVGKSAKKKMLDHFNLLPHHVWTDPHTGKIVRAWQPFNGLQVYNPDAWDLESDVDESKFTYPPEMCKAPPAGQNETVWRINCDDEGNYDGTPPPPEGLGHAISEQWKEMAEFYQSKAMMV